MNLYNPYVGADILGFLLNQQFFPDVEISSKS